MYFENSKEKCLLSNQNSLLATKIMPRGRSNILSTIVQLGKCQNTIRDPTDEIQNADCYVGNRSLTHTHNRILFLSTIGCQNIAIPKESWQIIITFSFLFSTFYLISINLPFQFAFTHLSLPIWKLQLNNHSIFYCL